MCWCVCVPVLVIFLMYVAVAVGNIQGKNRFTAAEGESRNSTVAGGGMLVSNKNSVKN